MKKAVMISKEQYDKVIGSYDKVIEELKEVKAQLSALQEQENILNALEFGEELQDIAALEKLFEHYITNLNYQPSGQGGAYPKAIWEALRWYDRTPMNIKRI